MLKREADVSFWHWGGVSESVCCWGLSAEFNLCRSTTVILPSGGCDCFFEMRQPLDSIMNVSMEMCICVSLQDWLCEVPVWGSNMMEEAASQLERDHVHSVYEKIAPYFNDSRYRAWPKVRQFLVDLEPGSIVADIGERPLSSIQIWLYFFLKRGDRVLLFPGTHQRCFTVFSAGCGNGKYLHINKDVFKLGCDVCRPLVDFAWSQGHEVQVCDGLHLPYRDGCFDAVLSIAGNGWTHTHEGVLVLLTCLTLQEIINLISMKLPQLPLNYLSNDKHCQTTKIRDNKSRMETREGKKIYIICWHIISPPYLVKTNILDGDILYVIYRY